MAAFDTHRTAYGAHGLFGRLGFPLAALVGAASSWNDTRMTRNELQKLSDRELNDIGLVRGDIEHIATGR
ncbi:DUF1127 domain-containing protein [Chachezhania antarctica]|uniref:DUF1127 domain-containing protein n=1 Tax=Chachezhania antarctica TaxID=2340860 RepID=UPI000EAF9DD1|nr:DUF1127 domain-containing protein [Chachezhania antarctica]|tara:strand:- start:893 stop:1102 length:210 start_codon:yes stop_codon:yes gene_type:complete